MKTTAERPIPNPAVTESLSRKATMLDLALAGFLELARDTPLSETQVREKLFPVWELASDLAGRLEELHHEAAKSGGNA
jgi:hypothetical protein